MGIDNKVESFKVDTSVGHYGRQKLSWTLRSTGSIAINVDKNFRSVFKVNKESGELKFRKFPIFTNVMNVQCEKKGH